MKILWIESGGPWIKPMLTAVSGCCDIEVLVPVEKGHAYKVEITDGIVFHYLPVNSIHNRMDLSMAKKYIDIIKNIKPDIIHVHGTEVNFGQIQNFITDIPVVISIQGILLGCNKYTRAYLSPKEVRPYKTLKNLLGRGSLFYQGKACEKGMHNYELDILKNGRYFFGRTEWDRSYLEFLNPTANYYIGEELLRDEFYEKAGSWSYAGCEKHSVFMSSGVNPLKGMHIAIKAIALLKRYYPDVRLKIPGMPLRTIEYKGLKRLLLGDEYYGYINAIIRENSLQDNIVFLPRLSATDMAAEMLKSNLFLLSSSIENSSNAVGEATMMGMPVVATYVGGIPSFMHNEENCLAAPSGDEFMIAHQIRRIFDDKEVAAQLGHKALKTALKRHDRVSVAKMYVDIYKKIIELK